MRVNSVIYILLLVNRHFIALWAKRSLSYPPVKSTSHWLQNFLRISKSNPSSSFLTNPHCFINDVKSSFISINVDIEQFTRTFARRLQRLGQISDHFARLFPYTAHTIHIITSIFSKNYPLVSCTFSSKDFSIIGKFLFALVSSCQICLLKLSISNHYSI